SGGVPAAAQAAELGCNPLSTLAAGDARRSTSRRCFVTKVDARASARGRTGFVVDLQQETEGLVAPNVGLVGAQRVDDLVQDPELLVRVLVDLFAVHEPREVVQDLTVRVVRTRFGVDARAHRYHTLHDGGDVAFRSGAKLVGEAGLSMEERICD